MSRALLSEVHAFAALPAAELDALAAIAEPIAVPDGERVFAQGEPAEALYVVEDGEIEIVLGAGRERPGGRAEKSLARRRRAELVGEMGVVDGSPRGASAFARGATRLLRLERQRFLGLVERHPRLRTALRSLMAERHAETVRRVLEP